MRRRLRSNKSTIFKLTMVGIVAMAGGFLLTSFLGSKSETQALSATEFQPGRIIDDSIFYNPNTMTAAEIDAFIDSHTPACDMWGTQMIYGVTRAEYVKQLRAQGKTKFHDPPFVCISEYYENPETHKTNFSTGGRKEAGMLSAGEIIYKAAHEYNINPQVLLVMLKKESYVWGDDWPHDFQYNTVMGYACPDGAPCDSKYFGFYNQVMMAAWQLNYYREHIYSYNYRPYATNNILYNPDRSCGSKAVYLENLATTSLYIYTPYVPNDGALANYPGTSWCGSYGNRNFYMYFREWFGSTLNGDEYYAKKLLIESLDSYVASRNYLGTRKSEDIECSIVNNNSLCYVEYQNGIVVSSRSKVYEVSGEIYSNWNKYANPIKDPGLPLTGEIHGLSQNGCYQVFASGYYYYTPATGAHRIAGGIFTEWFKQGTEWGPLGYPTSEEQRDENGTIYQQFQNGRIYWTAKEGAWTISARMFDKWSELGGEKGYLAGIPKADEICGISQGGCYQVFKNSYFYYTPETGAHEISGGIFAEWFKQGTEWGPLGYPTSEEQRDENGTIYQQFQNGRIYWP